MGKLIPAASIPRRSFLPVGNHTLAIESLTETSTDGLYALQVVYRSVWPTAGLAHAELFVIGTKEDPQAEDLESWVADTAVNAHRLFRMLDAARVPGADATHVDSEKLCVAATDCRFDAAVTHEIDDGERRPENRGKVYSRLAYFPEGSLDVGVTVVVPPPTAAAAPQVAPRQALPQRQPAPAPPAEAVAAPPEPAAARARAQRPIPRRTA